MAATLDRTTSNGKVRVLIPDTDITDPLFQDEDIAIFIELEEGVKRAAALALETAASNAALTDRVIRSAAGTSTDGAKVADALRARAAALRSQADADEARDGDGFDWAEPALAPFGLRNVIINDALRRGL